MTQLTNTVTTTVDVGIGPSEIAIGNYSKPATTATVDVQEESNSSGGSSSGDSTGKAHVVNSNEVNSLTDNISATRNTTVTQPQNNTLAPEQSNENPAAGAAPFAYITNYDDNTVSVIDTATNKVTSTVPVGLGPGGVAVAPDGKKVYVANNDSNSVSVIDTATNSVTANITASHPVYIDFLIPTELQSVQMEERYMWRTKMMTPSP